MTYSDEIIISPKRDRGALKALRELWSYRALLFVLAKRDVSVKFKQAAIGFIWVIFQPLISAAIFTVIFGVFAKFEAGETPYAFFVLSGMLLWQFFSRSASEGSNSLVSNSHLLTKVYFPRIVLPLVPILAAFVDFLLGTVVMIVLVLITGNEVSIAFLLIPLIAGVAALMAFGIAMILAPINALYRDVGIALPFLIQTLLFLTPVAYPASVVPERFVWLLDYHPLATLMALMRSATFGNDLPSARALIVLTISVLALLAVGARVMRRLEGTLVDRI